MFRAPPTCRIKQGHRPAHSFQNGLFNLSCLPQSRRPRHATHRSAAMPLRRTLLLLGLVLVFSRELLAFEASRPLVLRSPLSWPVPPGGALSPPTLEQLRVMPLDNWPPPAGACQGRALRQASDDTPAILYRESGIASLPAGQRRPSLACPCVCAAPARALNLPAPPAALPALQPRTAGPGAAGPTGSSANLPAWQQG